MYLIFLFFLLFLLQLNIREGFQIWNKVSGMDYKGDIGHSWTDLIGCKLECIRKASCKGIVTQYYDDGQGHCWLKSDMTDGSMNNKVNAYMLSRL